MEAALVVRCASLSRHTAIVVAAGLALLEMSVPVQFSGVAVVQHRPII